MRAEKQYLQVQKQQKLKWEISKMIIMLVIKIYKIIKQINKIIYLINKIKDIKTKI